MSVRDVLFEDLAFSPDAVLTAAAILGGGIAAEPPMILPPDAIGDTPLDCEVARELPDAIVSLDSSCNGLHCRANMHWHCLSNI